jgi:hypothetical protein
VIVAAVAETVEARRRAAEVDDDKEKSSQGIEAEMRAEPRQPDRQHQIAGLGGIAEQPADGADQGDRGHRQRRAVHHGRRRLRTAQDDRQNRQSQQSGDAGHLQHDRRHQERALVWLDGVLRARARGTGLAEAESAFNRAPRPCEWLAAPSSVNSIPAASKAATSLKSESTLPRTIVALDSIRRMVAT